MSHTISRAREKHGVDPPCLMVQTDAAAKSSQPAIGICPAAVSADVDLGVIITLEVVAASLLTGKLLTRKDQREIVNKFSTGAGQKFTAKLLESNELSELLTKKSEKFTGT